MITLLEKVTVSFDDFGISETSNDNIIALMALEKIDRISIMVHGVLRSSDIEFLLRSGAKLDIHLDRKNEILDNRKLQDGFLKRLLLFIGDHFFGEGRPEKVQWIWEEQLKKFQILFHKNPDGLNSHEHVHFFPSYFQVLLKLAQKYDIPEVRFGTQATKNYTFVALALNILRKFNTPAFRRAGVSSTSDILISWDWVHTLPRQTLITQLAHNQKTEIIFHPERPEEFATLKAFFNHPVSQ